MIDTKELFKKLQKECKKQGCYCPKDDCEPLREYANLPGWLRIYCFLYEKELKNVRLKGVDKNRSRNS